MSVALNHFFSEFKKQVYYLIFPVLKQFRYPSCAIKTRHIHPGAHIGRYVVVERGCRVSKGVRIGDYTYLNEGVRVDANTESIGRYCSISHNVKIGLGPHPAHFVSTSAVFYNPHWGFVSEALFDEVQANGNAVICDDVLIGANAVILAGVRVGTGAIVGAGAVVTKDVEPYSVVGGVPARKLRDRFPAETRDALMASRWWEQPVEELIRSFPMNDPTAFLVRWNAGSKDRPPAAP